MRRLNTGGRRRQIRRVLWPSRVLGRRFWILVGRLRVLWWRVGWELVRRRLVVFLVLVLGAEIQDQVREVITGLLAAVFNLAACIPG